MVQLYGEPAAETALYTFEDWARNIYGSSGWSGNSVIFTAIDKRMKLLSEASFKYRSLRDKRLFGGPGLGVLEEPYGPGTTTAQLFKRLEQDASLAGNAYHRIAGDRLVRLRPDWVTLVSQVERDEFGEESRVLLGVVFDPQGADPDLEAAFYPISEIAHWAPIPDPLANFRGMSWISAVLRELRGDIRMSEYREAFFKNSATPNLVIRYEQKMAPERLVRLRQALESRHVGADNAFNTLVLDEGADVQRIGASVGETGMADIEAAVETRMLMASGVPPLIAGARQGLEASQIGEYQQAMRSFADITIRPLWRDICGVFGKFAEVPAGAQLWFDVSDVSALQAGEQESATTSSQQAATINTLIIAGFTPESAVAAVSSGDMSLLAHTGLVSVQMQTPGAGAESEGAGTPTEQEQARSIAEVAQKIYLAVPGVISAEEARAILRQAGAPLVGNAPPPKPQPALPPGPSEEGNPS